MDFLSKLDWLMKRDGINKRVLAQRSGVPYTTIVGLYERGAENARLSTINRLCEFFSVPIDYLALDKYERPEDFVPSDVHFSTICEDELEAELIACYRSVNLDGRSVILATARAVAGNPDMKKDGSAETA